MNEKEPSEAFPYKPPSDEVLETYRYIFDIKKPLKPRLFKLIFDKFLALTLLVPSIPILILLKILILC